MIITGSSLQHRRPSRVVLTLSLYVLGKLASLSAGVMDGI